jgi:uncharacterized membrane protein
MFGFLRQSAFWAALGALLAALGVEVPKEFVAHILEVLAILAALVGIIRSMFEAGYRVKVEPPPAEKPAG